MDFSAGNTQLWHVIIQSGIIAAGLLLSNVLRRKIAFVRRAMVPTAVITGFLLLILRSVGWLHLDTNILEIITYHGIAIGFIALSLRVPKEEKGAEKLIGAKSGALIVSAYLMQAILGMGITTILAYTVMPGMFKAAGILLPMGYGQGPGQANNVGSTYEAMGFVGGQSFGLAIAAAGMICACVFGVIYINVIAGKKKLPRQEYIEQAEDVGIDTYQDDGEIPISESIDKFSIQVALVLMIYLLTYLVTRGLTGLVEALSPSFAETLNPLLWGFNFITGSLLAMGTRSTITLLQKNKIMTRQYQNNYLLSRISGFAFDLMIIAGIAAIDIDQLAGLWLPFILLSVAGGFVTLWYLQITCKKLYPDHYYENLLAMYGMLTGVISSGMMLLREVDPDFKTSAADNLLSGSSFGIIFGAPLLVIIGLAPKSDLLLYVSMGIILVYWALLLLFMYKAGPKDKSDTAEETK